MKLNAKNIAKVAVISAGVSAAIIFAVNNNVLGLEKALGKSGWF
ncbi:hypothetical protein [Aliivibrio kagoshimensis]